MIDVLSSIQMQLLLHSLKSILPLYRPLSLITHTNHTCPVPTHTHTHLFATSILYNYVELYSDFDISLKWSISNKHMWFAHRHAQREHVCVMCSMHVCDWLIQRNFSHGKRILLVLLLLSKSISKWINKMHFSADQFLI